MNILSRGRFIRKGSAGHRDARTARSTRMLALIFTLSLSLAAPAFAEPIPPLRAGLPGALSVAVIGNGESFSFDPNTGQITLPDGVIVNGYAINTKWDVNFDSPESDYPTLYEEIYEARCVAYSAYPPDEYERYQYEALELMIQSTQYPLNVCRMRLRPISEHFVRTDGWLVDVDLYMVTYHHEGPSRWDLRGMETHRIESYDVWNHVVSLAMEWYEPTVLRDAVLVEEHSMGYYSNAFPAYFDGVAKFSFTDAEIIEDFVDMLLNGEELDEPMAGDDYMHLRFITEGGDVYNIYIQYILEELYLYPLPEDKEDIMYARMGTNCYKINKTELYDLLKKANFPEWYQRN